MHHAPTDQVVARFSLRGTGRAYGCKWDGGGIPTTHPQPPLAFCGHLGQPVRHRMLAAGICGGPQDANACINVC